MQPARTTRPVGDRQVHLIDGAFDEAFVMTCNAWLDRAAYHRADYDHETARDYLHFKLEIQQNELAANPVTRMLETVVRREVEAVYGDLEPELQRVHVNLAPYGDHFTAHIDSAQGVTAIYFANREWRDEWHGETLFYAEGEPVAAVAPRPGRLALLPADMVHRVGAPSRLFAGARLTVAFKFTTREKPA